MLTSNKTDEIIIKRTSLDSSLLNNSRMYIVVINESLVLTCMHAGMIALSLDSTGRRILWTQRI